MVHLIDHGKIPLFPLWNVGHDWPWKIPLYTVEYVGHLIDRGKFRYLLWSMLGHLIDRSGRSEITSQPTCTYGLSHVLTNIICCVAWQCRWYSFSWIYFQALQLPGSCLPADSVPVVATRVPDSKGESFFAAVKIYEKFCFAWISEEVLSHDVSFTFVNFLYAARCMHGMVQRYGKFFMWNESYVENSIYICEFRIYAACMHGMVQRYGKFHMWNEP